MTTIEGKRQQPAARTKATGASSVVEVGRRFVLGLIGVAILIAIWWLVSLGKPPARLPTPFEVARALTTDFLEIPALHYISFQSGGIDNALLYTTISVLWAVGIGAAAGILVGLILGLSRTARELVLPILLVLSTVPVLILLPFLTSWLGPSRLVESGIVIFYAFVTLATVCQRAVESVGLLYRDYAETLGVRGRLKLTNVIAPAVLPDIIAGIRVALAAGWSFEAIGELIGGQQGAGRIIYTLSTLSDTAGMIAVVICLSAVAVTVDAVTAGIEKVVIRWRE